MIARGRLALALALAAGALLAAVPARAQEPPAPQPAAAAQPSEEERAKLAQIEEEAADLRARAEEWAARSAEYAQARVDSATRLRAIEAEIEALRSRQPTRIPPRATAPELEAALLGAEQDLALARRESGELEAEAERRAERRRQLPELLAAAKERLRALGEEPVAVTGEGSRLVEARQALAKARREATSREIEAHEQELASYEARGALLAKRLDRTQLRIAAEQERALAFRDALTARQHLDAERAAERARGLLEEAAALDPSVQGIVRRLAEENALLAEQRMGDSGLVGQIDEVSRKLANAAEAVAQVEADRARLVRKIEAAGLTGSVGLLLRKQRADAPDVSKYRRFIRMRRELIQAAQVRQIDLREQRRALANVDAEVVRAMDGIRADVPAEERAAIEALLRDLLETKRKYLDALIADHETYFQNLVDFDAKQQELIEKTESLLRFIDERILWVPSGSLMRPGVLADARDALAWLGDGRLWEQLGRALADALRATPLLNAAIALGLLLYAGLGGRARARIRALGEEARASQCTRYAPTAEALCLTLLLAPWLPGLAAYLGWRVEVSPAATQFARCVGGAVLAAAAVWLTVEVPRQLLRRGGIAEAHFGWPEAAVARLRRDLGWLGAFAVPAVLISQVFELRGLDAWQESVGRIAFALLVGALAVYTHLWLRRPGGRGPELLWSSAGGPDRPAGPIAAIAGAVAGARWRILHAVAVAVPALLGAAALGGYYWTALRLATRYHWTLCFVLALVVLLRLSDRWSLLARRRLAILRAREREAARAAQRPDAAEAGEAPAEEAPLDLADVDAQTSRLLQGTTLVVGLLGLWLIWAEVLPAAGILREVELWTTTQAVTLEQRDAAGELRTTREERAVPITLADLLLAALLAALTLLLVRNLPGFLEISLFRRVGLGAGERYAYATLAKYGVAVGGTLLVCSTVGMSWSSIQWLVAALGIGLGFGLQEIFANFVSGVILLFERPIRVGDTVTIGDLSGTVARIRTRATWLTGFDRKELIIPNKEFVTGRLVNWSLSDTILRVEVRVGIAYGSDVERALDLLRKVALENALVVREPRPEAWFLGFGESTLDLELRCFSPDAAQTLPIRHSLHLAIDRAFREAGIEIAFPQRDIHVRTLPPALAQARIPPGAAQGSSG